MIHELLSEQERSRLLGVLPVFFDEDETTQLKRQYESATRSAMEDNQHAKSPIFNDGVAVNVVRANLENHFKHAKRDLSEIRRNSVMAMEYGREFASIDNSQSTPEKRVNTFMEGRYLPNFEVYSRLVLGDNTGALDSRLAERALMLIASEFSGAELVHDEPRTRLKVTRIVEHSEGAFAVVKTKTDGLRVKVSDRVVDIKERRSGVVPLNEHMDETEKRALKVLANAAGDAGVTEDLVRPFRNVVAEYLQETDHYYPIIERQYLSRPIDD